MYLFFHINGLSSRAVIGQEPVIIHKSVYDDMTSLHDHAVSKHDRVSNNLHQTCWNTLSPHHKVENRSFFPYVHIFYFYQVGD